MADNEWKDTEKFTYRYFILGHTVPVRLEYDSLNRVTGAQIPDAGEPSGFVWNHDYLDRVYKSDEVDEVNRGVFDEAVGIYLANTAAREKKSPVIEPGF